MSRWVRNAATACIRFGTRWRPSCSNGVAIQDISDAVGHKSTHVTETVYRHVIVPAIRGAAAVMDDVFDAPSNKRTTQAGT
jgi:hypothetical protein